MTVSSDRCSAEVSLDFDEVHNEERGSVHARYRESRAEWEAQSGGRFDMTSGEAKTDLTGNVLSRLQFEFANLFGGGRP
jgi:hypothetical protein